MEMLEQALKEISVDRIRDHIASIEGVRHPVTAPAALEKAAEYIGATLDSLGYGMSEHCFDDGGSSFSNIVATRSGTRYPDQRVLVVAHFDTVSTSPGADDNASGVALLLELATILRRFPLERTIQFIAVNLEENASEGSAGTGTRGSRALARCAKENAWDIECVVVLESVAFACDADIQKAPAGIPVGAIPERADFIAVVGNENSKELVQGFCQVIDRYGIALPCFPLVVPGNGELLPDTRRSDHAPFWDRGYKAVMLTDTTNFRNVHYHQPSDTSETLNLEFAAKVCRATGAMVIELAGCCNHSLRTTDGDALLPAEGAGCSA
ncbi:MAG: peptidase M28 [Geobacteraceae bacterium GWC2_58_44]|nr:MAG: peptidase M28 [Geobacteraceae bacterium GWC2_58_44]HBG04628.1 peptidase M28 [Geobacter sp.]